MVEESDIKYDEVARKLAMVEGDLQRAEERANQGIIDNYNHMKRVFLAWIEIRYCKKTSLYIYLRWKQDCWSRRRIKGYWWESQGIGSCRREGSTERGGLQKAIEITIRETKNGRVEVFGYVLLLITMLVIIELKGNFE